jgi:SAM-dependent methyltransferase
MLEISVVANALYGEREARGYVDGAPHLKHRSLRRLYRSVVDEALTAIGSAEPRVLDLGAGEGTATQVFLDRGAHVTAVDDSTAQLATLRRRGAAAGGRLEVVHGRADEVLRTRRGERWDLVAAVSFLHHVPDYLSLVRDSTDAVDTGGAFLTFQDPLLHASLPRATHAFQRAAYASWRIRKGDVFGGLARRARRARGVWDDTCAQDLIEYHATRGGIDADALCELLRTSGFAPRVVRYFSTQSPTFQRVGTALGMTNTFAIIAPRA